MSAPKPLTTGRIIASATNSPPAEVWTKNNTSGKRSAIFERFRRR